MVVIPIFIVDDSNYYCIFTCSLFDMNDNQPVHPFNGSCEPGCTWTASNRTTDKGDPTQRCFICWEPWGCLDTLKKTNHPDEGVPSWHHIYIYITCIYIHIIYIHNLYIYIHNIYIYNIYIHNIYIYISYIYIHIIYIYICSIHN